MKYELVKSSVSDIDKLINYKRNTLYEYAHDLRDDEITKIENYVKDTVPKLLDNYFNIVVDGKIVGCLLVTLKDDGVLLDEIFIEEEYRNFGIGTSIINKVINDNDIVYLWVYKENVNAIKLYKRIGFNIIEDSDIRYYMKYCK